MPKVTQEEFIRRAKEKYGNSLDFSDAEYKGMHKQVEVVCPTHGKFSTSAVSLLAKNVKYGCPSCGNLSSKKDRKLTTEEFIKRAKEKYVNAFSFEKTNYTGATNKLIVTCNIHGDISVNPNDFLLSRAKTGCKQCGLELAFLNRRLTMEEFLSKAINKYGDKFDYTKTKLGNNNKKKVTVTCKIHGDFITSPDEFLNQSTYGCYKCARIGVAESRRLTIEEVICRIKDKFGNRFDLNKIKYKNSIEKITIGCKIHGWFDILFDSLIRSKYACPKCEAEAISKRLFLPEGQIINRIHEKFGNIFDTSKVVYTGNLNPIILICKKHGEFSIPPAYLFDINNNYGCPKCGREAAGEKLSEIRSLTYEEFINRCVEIHGNKYDYSKTTYTGINNKISIICPTHGEFVLRASSHLKGAECRSCTNTKVSRAEVKIMEFIESLGKEVVPSNRTIIHPYELDLVVEESKLAIEYCGLYWHSEAVINYSVKAKEKDLAQVKHLNKLQQTNKQGYRLLTIFEDEWIEKPEIVKQIIKRAIKVSSPTIIGARKTTLIIPTKDEAKEFFNSYHLQGSRLGQFLIALSYDDTIVSAISVGKRDIYGGQAEYEVIRYASHPDYYVAGGLSKMMRHLLKTTEIKSVLSYVDRRWFTGSEYHKNGFQQIKTTKPGYYYVKGIKRHHRAQFQKHKLHKVLENFDPNLTEVQNMTNHGYHRIFDCGQILFRYGAPPIP